MGKYVVLLVVALFATRLLLARKSKSADRTEAAKSLHRALDSTVKKVTMAVAAFIAMLVIILLTKHMTS